MYGVGAREWFFGETVIRLRVVDLHLPPIPPPHKHILAPFSTQKAATVTLRGVGCLFWHCLLVHFSGGSPLPPPFTFKSGTVF